MATYKNGKGHEDNQSDEGTYELINLNSISIDGGLKPSGKFIEDGSDTLLENDLVMVLSDVGHGDLLGRVAIIPENNRFVLNQRVALLRINDDTNPYFLFSIINRHQDYFKKLGAGSSQLNISRGTVEDFVVDYPCQDEQRKIAKCFQNLDTLITLHQCKFLWGPFRIMQYLGNSVSWGRWVQHLLDCQEKPKKILDMEKRNL